MNHLKQTFTVFSILTLLSTISLLPGCSEGSGLIPDKSQREEVKQKFIERKAAFEGKEMFGVFEENTMNAREREAMEFLYAYMPLVDIADYQGEYFLTMTKAAFEARETFSWGKEVPADLFRHFVLPPRVNNENLDTARIAFFKELKERIRDLSMYDAALEVNHWCHEKITYRPSDSRTSSPLASMKTGFGRCGEESTFTVTALRAVGIPARQCYTPRWAHTDDNHAWVEVWCSGKWYFMGACEPEPGLNMAWFTYPAKRAMMVHTNVFGKYFGPESKTDYPLYTKINVLENYTDTKKLEVNVYDRDGNTVEGAYVKYLIYNYSEYYPVYEKPAGKNGNSFVVSGAGDMVVWAYKDGLYGYEKASLSTKGRLTIKLDREAGAEYTEELDLTPPLEQARFTPSDQNPGREKNNQRLKYEDSLRAAYLSTFMKKEAAVIFARQNNLDASAVCGFIERSEGNW
ncbi:MAG: transglutaminase-like domain-containing protein, partial [Bacteroidales bacterium]|nr:transglutaminase-like domain-containing protein [Bacteroidales bacterium]